MSSTPKPDRVEEQGKDSPVASGAGGKEGLDPLPTPGDQALRLPAVYPCFLNAFGTCAFTGGWIKPATDSHVVYQVVDSTLYYHLECYHVDRLGGIGVGND